MTPRELRTARIELCLTKTQMAKVLEFGSYRAYQRLESGPENINPRVAKLVRAMLILSKTQHAGDFGL